MLGSAGKFLVMRLYRVCPSVNFDRPLLLTQTLDVTDHA